MESLFLDMLTNPWLLTAVLAIVFFASIVRFGLGMGFGLTAAPLLAVVDLQLVPAITAMVLVVRGLQWA